MLPSLSSSLLVKNYTRVRDLLDDARQVEDLKDILSPPRDRPRRSAAQAFGANRDSPTPAVTEKEKMIREGRCWGCRGSGHRSADDCCPRHSLREKRFHALSTGDLLDLDGSEDEKAGKA